MPKRFFTLIIITALCFVLQNCLNMRHSDSSAISDFCKKGITLGTHMLHISGHDLHYVSVGGDTMPTLVFVHGSPGSWLAFERYLMDAALRDHYRLISIDRPGYGYSDYGHALHVLDGCRLISSFLDSIKNGKPLYLAGHSLGGSIVPVLAAENPNTVSGIVILAGALDPALEPREPLCHLFTRRPFRYLLPGAFRQANDEEWYFKSDVLLLKDIIAQVRCPVYIVHASNDMIVDVGNVAYLKLTLTAAQVTDTILPAGNHFILWNHYDYIKQILLTLPNQK